MPAKSLAATFLLSLVLVQSASAASEDLDRRIDQARYVVGEIMASPDQSIPQEMLAKCEAIAIYPAVLKGGFILGARYGRGVVLKRDKKTGKWGPVAFSTIGGGSWGLQLGVQSTDLILVVMNDRGLSALLSNNLTLGADAEVAAGPLGRSSSVGTDLSLNAGILSYSRNKGLFAGVALDGAVLTQDNDSNARYYGKRLTSRDILIDGKADVRPSSEKLVEALNDYSKLWKKRIPVR